MFLMTGLDQTRSDFQPYLGRPEPQDLIWSVGFCLMFLILRHVSVSILRPLGTRVLTPAKRVQPDRLDRFASVSFKFVFYLVISMYGYGLMKDEHWCPPSLGMYIFEYFLNIF